MDDNEWGDNPGWVAAWAAVANKRNREVQAVGFSPAADDITEEVKDGTA